MIWLDYSLTISIRSLSAKPTCTGSGRGGGGGGRGGTAILTSKTFHGLLGQIKEVALGVSTTAVGCEGLESVFGFWLFVGVTHSVFPSWDSSDDLSFVGLAAKSWMFLSGLQPGGRLRVTKPWNQHFEKQEMRPSYKNDLTLS